MCTQICRLCHVCVHVGVLQAACICCMCIWGTASGGACVWDSRALRMPCACAGGLQALLRAWLCSLQHVCVCVRVPSGCRSLAGPPTPSPGDPVVGCGGSSANRDPGKFVAPSPGHPAALGGSSRWYCAEPQHRRGGGGHRGRGDSAGRRDSGAARKVQGTPGAVGTRGNRNTGVVGAGGGAAAPGYVVGHREVQGHGRRGGTQPTGGTPAGAGTPGPHGLQRRRGHGRGRRKGEGQRGHGT